MNVTVIHKTVIHKNVIHVNVIQTVFLNSGPAPCVPSDSQYDKKLIILIWILPSLLLFLIPTTFLFTYVHRRSKTSVNAKH